MTDTKTSALNFVNDKFVRQHKLSTVALTKSIKLRLANNELASNITHMIQVKFSLAEHVTEAWSLITNLEQFDLILRMLWLEQHDGTINFKARSIIFQSDYCLKHCIHNYQSTTMYSRNSKHSREKDRKEKHREEDIAAISVTTFMKMTAQEKNQVIIMWSAHFEMLNQLEENDTYLCFNTFTTNIAAVSVEDYEKFFNKTKKNPVTMNELKKKVSREFHKYIATFNFKKVDKLSSHREWDHKIELQSRVTVSAKRVYELSRQQTLVVKQYIDEMLEKEFIRESISHYAASVLIVKKPEEELRMCVNYRALNALIIKNRNAFSLIKEILARLCSAKIYSKFDIIAVFNEVRMRKENEHKTAFLTRYGLFEYVVMLFGLCNASSTFQTFINFTLREYLNDFCISYLDDIFIYSDNRKKHINHVFKILAKLKKAGLFLDINKCEFFVTSVKYLGLIIITKRIMMDSVKVEIIMNWKSPRNVKDVQAFLDFANFYRKFILDYSSIIVPLSKLTKSTEKSFPFPWNSNEPKEKAFRTLKLTFTTTPILQHFNADAKTWIETDAFDYVVTTVLSQREPDENLHSMTYMSKKMSPAECNYEIYDKKLLAIVRAFEKWRSKCAETLVESPVKILTNHKNLEHFMTFKQLNRRQIRWAEFLAEFNFKIAYKSDKEETKLDSLTRRSEDLFENHEDERHKYNHKMLLKKHYLNKEIRKTVDLAFMFMNESQKNAVTLTVMIYELSEKKLFAKKKLNEESTANEDLEENSLNEKSEKESLNENFTSQQEIMKNIKTAYSDDVILQRIMKSKRQEHRRIPVDITKTDVRLKFENCEIKENLFYVKNRVYVFQNDELYVEILRHIHETSSEGHVERVTTYDRVNRFYYWSKMTDIVARYVKECHHCKRTKHYREEKQDLLKSLPISDRYFRDISINFIISLPKCERNEKSYQHIMITVDRLSKKKRFIVLHSLKVKAVIQIFIKWIWRKKEYFNSIVSDRESQFVTHFWRRLCQRIDTNPKLFTAWHAETNEQTKIANANLKTFLRAYVNYNQNDWIDYLPITEFEANSAKSSFTDIKPFLTTKEYLSKSGLELPKSITSTAAQRKEMKNANRYVDKLEAIRVHLRKKLKWAQTKQKNQANKHKRSATEFKVENKIMLDARHLKTMRSNRELNYKNLKPFAINRVINNSAYQLNLSNSMTDVFPVFHLWLLHLNDSNLMPDQNDDEPEPVARNEDDDEYSVNEIFNSKVNHRKNDPATDIRKCLQYQIKWTEYANVNTRPKWYDYTEIENAADLVANFHHKYSDKPDSHETFVRPKNWKPLK